MPGNVAFIPPEVGFIVEVPIADPGAQTEWAYTFPDEYLYKLELIYQVFTADGNVVNRYCRWMLLNSTAVHGSYWVDESAVTAGQVIHFSLARNFAYRSGGGMRVFASPDCWIPGGWSIRSVTSNFQVADAYTEIFLLLRRYREQN